MSLLLPSMRDLEMDGRAVLMRLDLNVPLQDGVISSDARIRAVLPTISLALERGARLAVAAHLGRPKGERRPELSLEPVAVHLSHALGKDVILADDCIGDGVRAVLQQLRSGQVMLLQNLRYHGGETANDPGFSRALAAPFQVYVNDAFGASHRAHASIVGVAQHLPLRAAGLLFAKEVAALSKVAHAPEQPCVAVVGGAKVADKLGILQALLDRCQAICIGGAMAYTFLDAQGVAVGASPVQEEKRRAAAALIKGAQARGVALLLPQDHVVAETFAATAPPRHASGPAIEAGFFGLDIGEKTRAAFAERVRAAKTVFWNGPMGVFEWEAFAAGTHAVAQAVAASPAYTVVGGGDSVAAIEAAGVSGRVDHISTGGGSSLAFIEKGTLVGIEALAGRFAGS